MSFENFNTAVDAHETIKQIIRTTKENEFPAPRLATVSGVLNTVSMTVAVTFHGDETPVIISCSAAAAPVTPGQTVRVEGTGNNMLIVDKYGWYPRDFEVRVVGPVIHSNVGAWGTLKFDPAACIEVVDRADPVGLVRWRPDSNPNNTSALYINPPDATGGIYLSVGTQGHLPFDIDSTIQSWALYMDYQSAADSMNNTGLDYAPGTFIETEYDEDTDTWALGRSGLQYYNYIFYLVNTDINSGLPWVIPSSWALIATYSSTDEIVCINKQPLSCWTDYTPVWSSSGTQPTLGATTMLGRYIMTGPKTCFVHICMRIGTGASGGTGTYMFTLPFTAESTKFPDGQYICSRINPATTVNYTGLGWIPASDPTKVRAYCAYTTFALAVVSGSAPALSVGAQLDFWGEYQIE